MIFKPLDDEIKVWEDEAESYRGLNDRTAFWFKHFAKKLKKVRTELIKNYKDEKKGLDSRVQTSLFDKENYFE